MKLSSKYLPFTKRLKYSIVYKTYKTSTRAKSKETQYKIINKENKIWRIIPGHLSARRKGRDAIGNDY
jgi:hypothetical protein